MALSMYDFLFHRVALFLPTPAILSLCASCSSLNLYRDDPQLWDAIIQRDFPWRSEETTGLAMLRQLTLTWTILRTPICDVSYQIREGEVQARKTLLGRCDGWVALPDGAAIVVVSNEKESIFTRVETQTWAQTELARLSPATLNPRLVYSTGKLFLFGGHPYPQRVLVLPLTPTSSFRRKSDLEHNSGPLFACTSPEGDILLTSNRNVGQGLAIIERFDPIQETVIDYFQVRIEEVISLGMVSSRDGGVCIITTTDIVVANRNGERLQKVPCVARTNGFPVTVERSETAFIQAGDEVFEYKKTSRILSKIRVFSTSAYLLSITDIPESLEEDDDLLGRGY